MVDTGLTKEEAIEEIAFETCNRKRQVWDNSIKVGVSMSKAFSNFNFLTVINLRCTDLENEGTIALVNALKNSAPSLEVIEMAGNNITDETAPDIAACLAAKRHLKKLKFSKSDPKHEGCVVIVKSVVGWYLEYVDMSYNDLEREGALGLGLGLGLGLIHVVDKKEDFKVLNFDGKMISIKGIEEVRGVFKNWPKLLGLLDENDFDGGVNEDYEDEKDNVDDDDKHLEGEMNNLEVFEDEFVSVFIFY